MNTAENEYPKFVYDAQLRMFFKLRTASEEYYFMRNVGEAPMPISKEEYELSGILTEKDGNASLCVCPVHLKWDYDVGKFFCTECHKEFEQPEPRFNFSEQPQWRPIDQFDLPPGVPFWGYEPGPVGVFPCHQGQTTGGCFLKYTKATHFMPCEGNYQIPVPPKANAEPAVVEFNRYWFPIATELLRDHDSVQVFKFRNIAYQAWLAAKAKGRE